jgi:ABC-type multidrug transport system ATPase subunit
VLDDPTLGLDPVARRGFFGELLEDLARRGTTVFLTTHDLAAVEGIASRVGILAGGRLRVDEELETLRARFRRVKAGAGEGPAIEGLRPVARTQRPWGLEVVVEGWHDGADPELDSGPMSLEEIFAALHVEGGAAAGEVVPADTEVAP